MITLLNNNISSKMRPYSFRYSLLPLKKNTLPVVMGMAVLSIALPSAAQDVTTSLPAVVEQQLQEACRRDAATDTEDDINNVDAASCADAASGLAAAAASTDDAAAIAARATQIGSDGTGGILAESLAEQFPDAIADIINAMIAVQPEQAAEMILAAASTFPERDQDIILGQLVAAVSAENPNAVDSSAFAAILESLPSVGQAATGLTGLDLVSPN